jgi:hypothetical protein
MPVRRRKIVHLVEDGGPDIKQMALDWILACGSIHAVFGEDKVFILIFRIPH